MNAHETENVNRLLKHIDGGIEDADSRSESPVDLWAGKAGGLRLSRRLIEIWLDVPVDGKLEVPDDTRLGDHLNV